MKRGPKLITLYMGLLLLPLAIAGVFNPHSYQTLLYEIGNGFALTGIVILLLQPLLASRFAWIERPFGLDIVIRFHKYMAIIAACLLLAHPLLLTAARGRIGLLVGVGVPFYIWIGRIALVLVLLSVLISLFQERLGLRFEQWRLGHGLSASLIITLPVIHSWLAGEDLLTVPALRWYWIVLCGASISTFAYHRFIRPKTLDRHRYNVIDVHKETDDVWTVKLSPPERGTRYDYLPGQFQFLTFHRGRGLPVEEHHWTISSSPTELNYVSSTIKALGDFTSTIGETRPGDTATVHAPFGRFSYVLHPEDRDIVFVVGGIGITPVMSMLRHMRDTRWGGSALLIYANPNQHRIVFREELEEMATDSHPRLRIVHVLSRPEEGWSGETGHVDREKIERFCDGRCAERSFYVCGPPGLLKATIENLGALGVPDARIRIEIFSFLS